MRGGVPDTNPVNLCKNEQKKKAKRSARKIFKKSSKESSYSFISSKVLSSSSASCKPRRRIKIKVYDMSDSEQDSDSEIPKVCVQYIVTERYDEIMNLTDNIVRKISEKICD